MTEANDALIASTLARPRKGSGWLQVEEEFRAGRGEKLSPRRSTGSKKIMGEADTRFVVSAAAPQLEGGTSLPVSPARPPADVMKFA